ncbi:MAG: hypothetical protein ABSG97_07925 [Sedimentisphaerales bacterium]
MARSRRRQFFGGLELPPKSVILMAFPASLKTARLDSASSRGRTSRGRQGHRFQRGVTIAEKRGFDAAGTKYTAEAEKPVYRQIPKPAG